MRVLIWSRRMVSVYLLLTFCVCMFKVIYKVTQMPSNSNSNKKLLTLFTSAKMGAMVTYVHNNTLRNWEQFADDIILVFYGNYSDCEIVRRTNTRWHTRLVPRYSSLGLPILKYMFQDVISNFNSTYYGYANADIMFTNSLVKTLKTIELYESATKGLLITGQRTNVAIKKYFEGNIKIYINEATKMIAKESGCLFTPYAMDYFITSPLGFAWDEVLDLMIGSVGYDNYLMAFAILKNYMVIDATGSILAVHQTDSSGNYSGRRKKDGQANYMFLNYTWRIGMTACAPYLTNIDLSGRIYVTRRASFWERCQTAQPEHRVPEYKCDSNGKTIMYIKPKK
jgi:hypothetical protein